MRNTRHTNNTGNKVTAQEIWERLSKCDPPTLTLVVDQKLATKLVRAVSMAKHKSNKKLGVDADNRRLTTSKEDLPAGKVKITFSLAEGVIRASTPATTFVVEFDDDVDFVDFSRKTMAKLQPLPLPSRKIK